jgi:hypothetical protein
MLKCYPLTLLYLYDIYLLDIYHKDIYLGVMYDERK